MERTIKVTLSTAKEWYQKGGDLRAVALQAFSEEELRTKQLSAINLNKYHEIVNTYDRQHSRVKNLRTVIRELQIPMAAIILLHNLAYARNSQVHPKQPMVPEGETGYFINVTENSYDKRELPYTEIKFHTSVKYLGIPYFYKKEHAEEALAIVKELL